MKQILQSLKTGDIQVVDVPLPKINEHSVLIETTCSLVSSGTERMLVEFGTSNLIGKALQQPERLKQVLDKCRTDGLLSTYDAVQSKLDSTIPLGYSNVGRVIEVGSAVSDLCVGDRVVSNGCHAEVVSVSRNLCAKIPDEVSDSDAAFVVLSAVALQGLRLLNPTLGESFVVTGLGLVGLLAVQLLRANGCAVLAIDKNPARISLAERLGAKVIDASKVDDLIAHAQRLNDGRLWDGIIVATATQSTQPITDAVKLAREGGRIIIVGTAGLSFDRTELFKKQLRVQVSRSYGPGRYDKSYEELSQDYPIEYVRWTAQRNFEAVLQIIREGKLRTDILVSHKFMASKAKEAYRLLTDDTDSLGIIFNYPSDDHTDKLTKLIKIKKPPESLCVSNEQLKVGFLGAGSYSTSKLIPAFSRCNTSFKIIAANTGANSYTAATKFGFERCTSDASAVLEDPDVDAVVIATRHDSHANYILQSLRHGKHVFVEKPLCMNLSELEAIRDELKISSCILTVGFNRRFSPFIRKIRDLLSGTTGPKIISMNVNAGKVDSKHWSLDALEGGGRLLGECCHFIDTLRFLVDKSITKYSVERSGSDNDPSFIITLKYADDSVGIVNYFTNGPRSLPKERIEIFCDGKALMLDNYRVLKGHGWKSFKLKQSFRQDKGQNSCVESFVDFLLDKSDSLPIPYEEIIETSDIAIKLSDLISSDN